MANTRFLTLLLFLVLGAAAPAQSAAPPGHPTPGQARDMMLPDAPPSLAVLQHEGRVLSTLDANQYTYIEVQRADVVEWLAAPLMAIKPGSTVRYEEGSEMRNFFSKLLKRTFVSLRFVGEIQVTAEP